MRTHSVQPGSTEQPEVIVKGFLDDLDAGRGEAARKRLSPDYALEIVGEGSWALGGSHQGENLSSLMRMVRQRFPTGLTLTIQQMTSQHERVIVEASSQGVRRDGRAYRNNYVFIFVVRNGLIESQREFCDIIAADEILCGPMGADDEAACGTPPGKVSLAQDH